MALGMSLLLLAFFELLWRTLAPRVAPRLFHRHPSLWGNDQGQRMKDEVGGVSSR